MKVFSVHQTRNLDSFTIKHEPIASVDLMERAANALYTWFGQYVPVLSRIAVFCGSGNNGGDGLALARLLYCAGYNVAVYYINSLRYSDDFGVNLSRLKELNVALQVLDNNDDFPELTENDTVVDALYGSGLNRPIDGIAASLVSYINRSNAYVIAIDIPSGLFGDENPYPNQNPAVEADVCLCLQFPKRSLFFPENYRFAKEWYVLPIGIHPQAIAETVTDCSYFELDDARRLVHERPKFSHKGTYGHALIVAGSYGMMGAAAFCAKSCQKSGTGLVTLHVPQCGYTVVQQLTPEVLALADGDELHFSAVNDLSKYSSACFGPGIGTHSDTLHGFRKLIAEIQAPLLVDADGLNIISRNRDLLNSLPPATVITPHPGEFDRLFGKSTSGSERLFRAVDVARQHKLVIVLKGAYTQVVSPDGSVSFNSTGNPGMATGGSGDVLSGIITGLLAQKYNPLEAALLGVFVHGLAGDIAVSHKGSVALTAMDIVDFLPDAFNALQSYKNL